MKSRKDIYTAMGRNPENGKIGLNPLDAIVMLLCDIRDLLLEKDNKAPTVDKKEPVKEVVVKTAPKKAATKKKAVKKSAR
jgi:hypothetical protein